MTYDVDSTTQSNNLRRQQEYAGRWGVSCYEQMMPKAEMLAGDWYLVEFGDQTREIKARDYLLSALSLKNAGQATGATVT
jgi:hypothetical protein